MRLIDSLINLWNLFNHKQQNQLYDQVGSNNSFTKRCSLLSISLQYCTATATKVQSRRPSSHSKENWNFSSWLQDTIHWRIFHNFTYLQKIPQHMLSKTWTTKSFKVNSLSLNWSSLSVPHQQQPPKFSRVWTVYLIKSQKYFKNDFFFWRRGRLWR